MLARAWFAALAVALLPAIAAAAPLRLGDEAPDFSLVDQRGKSVRLSDFRGKANVVIAFYVMAFTPGWTRELKAYQADTPDLADHHTQVVAISVDDAKTVRDFAEALGVTYPLLSDETRAVSKAYGVIDPSGRVARRVTFVVDSSGIIRKIEEGEAAMDPAGVVTFCKLLDEGGESRPDERGVE